MRYRTRGHSGPRVAEVVLGAVTVPHDVINDIAPRVFGAGYLG